MLDPDGELDTLAIERAHQLVVLKPAVGAQHDLAVVTGAANSGE
jgi:hypothetical protein